MASTANLTKADGICFGLTVMLSLCQPLCLNHRHSSDSRYRELLIKKTTHERGEMNAEGA